MPDELDAIIRQMSKDIGQIETKVDYINTSLNQFSKKLEEMEKTVLRRETIHDEISEFRKELSSKFMWCVGYCTALSGIIIALLKTKAL